MALITTAVQQSPAAPPARSAERTEATAGLALYL